MVVLMCSGKLTVKSGYLSIRVSYSLGDVLRKGRVISLSASCDVYSGIIGKMFIDLNKHNYCIQILTRNS